LKCPSCGGPVQSWDKAKRHGYLEDGTKLLFQIRIVKCKSCKKKHRVLPSFLIPYKRFLAVVIARTILAGCPRDTCAAEYETQRQWLQWYEDKEQEFELTLRQDTPLDESCGFASLLSELKELYPVEESTEEFELDPDPDSKPVFRHWKASNWLSKIIHLYVLFNRGKCPPSYSYLSSA
jgi:hypothetical protein